MTCAEALDLKPTELGRKDPCVLLEGRAEKLEKAPACGVQ